MVIVTLDPKVVGGWAAWSTLVGVWRSEPLPHQNETLLHSWMIAHHSWSHKEFKW